MTDSKRPAADVSGDERRVGGDGVDSTASDRERALELANDAARFCEAHPDVWSFIVATMLREVEQGGRASIQRAVELARKRDFLSFKAGSTPINNRLRPFLVRRFELAYPEARGHVETRRSLADLLSRDELLGGGVIA